MAHSIIVDSDSFSSNINSFEETVKNVEALLKRMSEIMKEVDGENETWKSKSAQLVHEDFSQIEGGFEEINTKLTGYVTFLKDTLENYEKEENKLEKSIEDNSLNLDVNE